MCAFTHSHSLCVKEKINAIYTAMAKAATHQLDDRLKTRRTKLARLDHLDRRNKEERSTLMIEIYAYQKLLKRRKKKDLADKERKLRRTKLRQEELKLEQQRRAIRLEEDAERMGVRLPNLLAGLPAP